MRSAKKKKQKVDKNLLARKDALEQLKSKVCEIQQTMKEKNFIKKVEESLTLQILSDLHDPCYRYGIHLWSNPVLQFHISFFPVLLNKNSYFLSDPDICQLGLCQVR